jgi:1-aminocyclopropane-1-carboxylate deaminase
MIKNLVLPSPLQYIEYDILETKKVHLYIKRDDLIHPYISGNKWRKLKYLMDFLVNNKIQEVVSFGGAYSNHLMALAEACYQLNIKAYFIVRGEAVENENIVFLREKKAELFFVSRLQYKSLTNSYNENEIFALIKRNAFIVREGGEHPLAIKGCKEIIDEIDIDFDVICCPVGTATTLTGITSSLSKHQRALGFSALKGEDFLSNKVKNCTDNDFYIDFNYHFGGYAKTKPELLNFIENFYLNHGIMLDYVYTSKMMFGIFDYIAKDKFKKGTTIVALHTGGVKNATLK